MGARGEQHPPGLTVLQLTRPRLRAAHPLFVYHNRPNGETTIYYGFCQSTQSHKVTQMNKLIVVALSAALLSGCGMLGGQPGGPGNTDAAINADGSMHYRSGKDFASIKGKFSRPDGLSGEFEAQGVDATSGLKVQAEAMKAQSDSFNRVLDMLIQIAGPALKGAMGGAALSSPGRAR